MCIMTIRVTMAGFIGALLVSDVLLQGAEGTPSLAEGEALIEELWERPRGTPRTWGEELTQRREFLKEKLKSAPEMYATMIDSRLALPQDLGALGEFRGGQWVTFPHYTRLYFGIQYAKHLGPEHGAPLLREFEAVLRTRMEDLKWLMERAEGEDEKKRFHGQVRALHRIYNQILESLAELEDASLIPYIFRTFEDIRPYYPYPKQMDEYLLSAVERDNAMAREALKMILEKERKIGVGILQASSRRRAKELLDEE